METNQTWRFAGSYPPLTSHSEYRVSQDTNSRCMRLWDTGYSLYSSSQNQDFSLPKLEICRVTGFRYNSSTSCFLAGVTHLRHLPRNEERVKKTFRDSSLLWRRHPLSTGWASIKEMYRMGDASHLSHPSLMRTLFVPGWKIVKLCRVTSGWGRISVQLRNAKRENGRGPKFVPDPFPC